jgi:signal transduction histidine kinase
MKSTRVFQLTTLALVLVSVVQVGWWLFDQRSYTQQTVAAARTGYAEQTAAAQALLDAGTAPERVRALLPQVAVSGGHATLAQSVSAALASEERSRQRQYAWEGAFFLLALGLCIAVIARALRAEAQVLEEQDSFLALVSHQFKTPLASLQLSLETLALRAPPPQQARVLIERMLADLARMELMVTQILESARLERGRVDFKSEPLQLAGAVARVVTQLEERARQGGVSINARIEPTLYVMSDPLALDVVVRNVLENALAALAPLGAGTIALSGRTLGSEVELDVRDSGVGFARADGERLFEKFTRLHPGGGGGYYGTGLGLFIVRRLMELAHGRVSAHSEGQGQGARFLLVWPAPVEPHS